MIELDGSQHYEPHGLSYDAQRSAYFETLGLTVIRFTNTDIDRHFDDVCTSIHHTIEDRLNK